jgi:hypothetical protein
MGHKEEKGEKLEVAEPNCNKCVLQKMDICPYLETVEHCHLFSDSQRQMISSGFEQEKRQYPRVNTSVPAYIIKGDSRKEKINIGLIKNISLGGVRISIPKALKYKALAGPHATELEIIVVLPVEAEPIQLKCKPRRVTYSQDNIDVGASLVDVDFRSYEALRNYLM